MDAGLLLLLLAVGVAAYLFMTYNRMVALRQNRGNAFSDIDVQLKLRCDLVPNLVETVKGYAGHEKQVLENVTQARSRAMAGGGVNERIAAENALGGALANLLAVAENYPDLKANQNFQQLQAELSDVENKIAAARRFFNNATNEYNTLIEQFPGLLIAGRLGFAQEPFFEPGAEERAQIAQAPKVAFP